MDIKVGDRVRFLNDVGEGIVTCIVNKNIANVLIEDGFELPTHVNELVVIEKAAAAPQKKETADADYVTDVSYNYAEREDYDYSGDIEEIEGNENPNVFFAFVPDNHEDLISANINIYLVNDCNYYIMYTVASVSEMEACKHLHNGILNPNTKFLLTTLQISQLSQIKKFHFNLLFFKNGEYNPVSPVENSINLKHLKFLKDGCFDDNDFFDEKAIIYCITKNIEDSISHLTETDITKISNEKQASEEYQKSLGVKFKPRPEPVTEEVDLHINQLLVDCRGLSNSEILDHQIKHFHKKMEEAISSRLSKIVFIHGIGNGTLKNELRKTLTNDYPEYKFQDASFKEYGYGATLVILK
ncbi:MAG: DUF2027 domain-containing protein [Bacteroidia bacterium]|nr:DUF2027 domain-containing protein [Bacteroidia bacterium]